MAALIIAIFPQNSSRGNWEEQQDRTDPNSQFELARKPAWLLAFRQFGLPKWKHDFECGTLQPLGQLSVYFRRVLSELAKIFWREKQERNHKSIRFEILKTRNLQGFSGGRNSQIPPKFRVSPVMTTSIPLLVTGCIIPYFPLGCNFFFCGVYFDAAAHVLMGEGGRLWRSGC